ncbi:lamin tail domain-containing protein [Sinomicrobium sp.]
MKTTISFLYILSVTALLLGVVSCKTDDVEEGSIIVPTDPVLIPDAAFGEYLLYNQTPGVYEQQDGNEINYYLNPTEVISVSELLLSKTASNIETLQKAGLATADVKITDLSGLEYFIGLQRLALTSNSVREIDLTSLSALEQLEINFNLIGQLDLSGNPELTTLRYHGSGNAEESELLSELDLSANTQLRHLFLPDHNLVNIDLSNNPNIDEMLDLSGNPGPDSDTDTADIVVPDAIYNQLGEGNRLGVISDAHAETIVTLTAAPSTFSEDEGASVITASLNMATDKDVTINLNFSGSATLDEDYTVENTSLVIPAGETSITTTITAIQDADEEGNETIEITASDVQNAELNTSSPLILTIEDDDKSIPLVLNEILYDPSNSGLDGDANGDGVYAQNEDEFIELYNDSDEALDVSGFKVYDTENLAADIPNHLIPEGTVIPAHGVLVIFGGGTPTGDFGGAIVQTSTFGDLNLNNDADILTITDADGKVIITFDVEPYSNNPNEALTRYPDVTGEFTRYKDIDNGFKFTPGTKADGSPF